MVDSTYMLLVGASVAALVGGTIYLLASNAFGGDEADTKRPGALQAEGSFEMNNE